MEYSFGFIGCGNMGGALVRAVAKTIGGNNISVCDFDSQKAQKLANDCGAKIATAGEIAQRCSFIVLGVKPQNMLETLAPIQAEFYTNKKSDPGTLPSGPDFLLFYINFNF